MDEQEQKVWDEPSAQAQIDGKVSIVQGIIRSHPGVVLSEDDLAAINYLCSEWDFGYRS